ncbi:MAG TPA: MFS transporter [Ramlibacter sp.]|nr:MFS transporter [Ramlibacter sp.]
MQQATTTYPDRTESGATNLPLTFQRLAWGNLAAQTAEQLALAAAPLVAVLAFDAHERGTGLLQTAQTLPFLLLCLPAGLLADRISRRTLLISGELVRFIALAITLALFLTHGLSFVSLAVLGFVGAAGTVVFSVTAPALVPRLVTPNLLPIANSRLELARSAAFAAGPALGGALVAAAGAPVAFALATALSGTALAWLRTVREPARPSTAVPRRRPLRELLDGAVFVWSHPLLRPLVLTAFFYNVGFFIVQAVYVPYAIRHLQLGAFGVGVTMAVYGVGMVLGALAATRVMRRFRLGRVLLIGPFAGLVACIVLLATVWWREPALAALSYLLLGSGAIVWVISSTTLRQAVTHDAMLGRASAVLMTATWGARPLGALIGAAVGGWSGATMCLAIAVVAFAAQAAIIGLSAPARLDRLPKWSVA